MRCKSGRPVLSLILAGVLALTGLQARAQTSAAGWDSVQRLAKDQSIRVRSRMGSSTCDFDFADEQRLTCVERHRSFFVLVEHTQRIRRADIRSVRLSRQGLSLLGGAAAGAGLGAAIGAGIGASVKNHEDDGLVTLVFVFLGGMMGSGVGQHSDFLAGPLVYQAP